jgi:hypothetical protein
MENDYIFFIKETLRLINLYPNNKNMNSYVLAFESGCNQMTDYEMK